MKHRGRRIARRLLRAGLLLAALTGLALAALQLLPTPASPAALAAAEGRLLARIRSPWTYRSVQAGAVRMNTVVVGDGTKPPIVLLHGHGGGLAIFFQNFDALATAYTVYAVDLPGWGRSDRPHAVPQTAAAVRDGWVEALEQWRAAVGLDRFTLLGHSLGGFVAASYALAHPERLDHLVLVDAAGVTAPIDPADGLYFHLTPQRVVRLAGPLGPRLLARARRAEAGHPATPLLNDYFYQLSAAPPSGERAFLHLLTVDRWKLPLLDDLGRLPMPVTILWGAADDLTKPRNGELARDRLPGSVLVTFPETGHLPFLERPEAFARALLQRAAALRAPGAHERSNARAATSAAKALPSRTTERARATSSSSSKPR